VISPYRDKEGKNYRDETRDLFNIPHTKLNTLLSPFLLLCKPLKKIKDLFVKPGLRGSNDLRVRRKMVTFQLFFSHGNRW
jgi:hypothetical protein